MSSIARFVGRRFAKGKASGLEPKDPHYETTTDAKGRKKRKQRELPPGLSKEQAAILRKVRKRAHRLDKGMSLCGFRVGWTFWLGLIPMAGDIVDALLGYNLVIKPAQKCDLPPMLRERMILNLAFAIGLGAIPLIGDVMMATVKPNSRNAWLLEEFLISRVGKGGSGQDSDAVQSLVHTSKSPGFFDKKTGEAQSASKNGSSAGGSAPPTTAPSAST